MRATYLFSPARHRNAVGTGQDKSLGLGIRAWHARVRVDPLMRVDQLGNDMNSQVKLSFGQ